VPVEVRDEDLSGVVVDIQKGATLNGQIVLQDDPGDTPPRFERIDLNLVPTRVLPEYAQPMRASGLQRRVDESGRFVVENVPQGEYRLVLEGGLPPGTYLADVRQGAASIYSSPTIWFDTADPTPIEIVLARGGGRIQGNVRFGTLPAGDGSVVLVPEPGHRENFSLYRVNGTSAGEFSFRDIAPGRYSVFAVESLPEGAEWNREFLARYEGRGLPVTIERDEIVVVELQRIPALP
jgi:hypothetical protein